VLEAFDDFSLWSLFLIAVLSFIGLILFCVYSSEEMPINEFAIYGCLIAIVYIVAIAGIGIKMVFNEISFWWKNKVCVK